MTESLPPIADRQVVFVSHANPEDNAFATWLTLRLTREGYRVWCDVVKLMGGDDFWRDVEKAIRQHTRRFIYVTSRISNQKPGTLQELAVASGVARQLEEPRFIIPVKVDDLAYSDHNIQINRLNALSFTRGWAEGFGDLLRTLRDDGIPKPEPAGPSCVASWWNTNRLNHEILLKEPEMLWTNWFALKDMPRRMWVWDIPENAKLADAFAFPTYRQGDKLLSYANATALLGKEGSPTGGKGQSFAFNLNDAPPGRTGLWLHHVRTAAKQLLIQAWNRMAEERGLPLYEMSSRRRTLWFPLKSDIGDMVSFGGVDGKICRRALYGYKTMKGPGGVRRRRHWHFGLEAMPILYPRPALALKSHVIFTSDGENPIGDPKAQHAARRSQCKEWWNDKWRDMTLAAVTWLASEDRGVEIPVRPEANPVMELRPIKYRADVSYDDASVRLAPQESKASDDESQDEEDNDEI
jgi:hypothetical protein